MTEAYSDLNLLEYWIEDYNHQRPHFALGSRTPAPETIVHMDQLPVMR
ncbi:integrase core domain-containing protein [Sedimentitalea todarodis]|nr:integrase core domain-containing protein [Sedimentitalea todarodis]